jgi:hypothetical protein
MTNPTPSLAPCPFCGENPTLVNDNGPWLVECVTCRAASGRAPYEAKAAKLWNRRALPAPTGAPDLDAAEGLFRTKNDPSREDEIGLALCAEIRRLRSPSPGAGAADLRDRIAKIICKESLDADAEKSWFSWCESDRNYYRAQADEILAALSSLPPQPAAPAPDLDADWFADREMGPVGVDRDLWRSLHDLCRMVRSTTGESIRSHLEAYLSGAYDDFGAGVRLHDRGPVAPLPAPGVDGDNYPEDFRAFLVDGGWANVPQDKVIFAYAAYLWAQRRASTPGAPALPRVYEVWSDDGCEAWESHGLYARREDAMTAMIAAMDACEDKGMRFRVKERDLNEPSQPQPKGE